MKREKSIELLNSAVNEELSAIHQYMYFHFRYDDLGYELFSQMFKRIAIHEMLHLQKLAERILFLNGEIHMVPSCKVEKLLEPKDMLQKACHMEINSVNEYNTWVCECDTELDAASKTLFEVLLKEEELHQSQFEAELDNLKKFGDTYLVLQSVEHRKLQSHRDMLVRI